jgi:hypothetical protein
MQKVIGMMQINGYWSPLYSWLIAPFLLSGFDPFQSVIIPRALLLITGFFTIIGVNQLAKTFELEGMVKTACWCQHCQ